MDPVDAFRQQAVACARLGSPMYADLLERCADDLVAADRSGAVARAIAGHEADPGPSALALRLLGAVHRIVLSEGRSAAVGALAAYYPSVGGSYDGQAAWPAFADLLRSRRDEVSSLLSQPPQTNEVGRSAALLGALCHVGARFDLPVRLFEIGASAGLNLQVDRLDLRDGWQGPRPPEWPGLRLVERLGCDLAPIDSATDEGRLLLTAYVWPDQVARLERLQAAIALARRHPVQVRRQDAASFVDTLDPRPGATTVLWHSVMWQYLPAHHQERITARLDRIGAAASSEAPFAHVFAEPARRTPGSRHEFLVVAQVWPGGERRVLGKMHPHGVPVVWE